MRSEKKDKYREEKKYSMIFYQLEQKINESGKEITPIGLTDKVMEHNKKLDESYGENRMLDHRQYAKLSQYSLKTIEKEYFPKSKIKIENPQIFMENLKDYKQTF